MALLPSAACVGSGSGRRCLPAISAPWAMKTSALSSAPSACGSRGRRDLCRPPGEPNERPVDCNSPLPVRFAMMKDKTGTGGGGDRPGRLADSAAEPADSEATTASRLLVLAAELFRQKGYGLTTTRELASRLGIQKASLYHHMRGKEDLLFAISVESLRRITEAVTAARDSADADRRLHAMIMAHLGTALRDQDMHTTMLIELRALSEERQKEVRAQRDAYQDLLRSVISDDQSAGRLRADIGAEYLTLSLLNLLNWTIFWFTAGGERTIDELAVMMSTIFLDGARVRQP
jgi:TetR/AcrR family transcriptional regulator, cholesterol catabolism regulator